MLKGDKINVFYFILRNSIIFEKKMKKKIYADDPEINDLTTPGVQSISNPSEIIITPSSLVINNEEANRYQVYLKKKLIFNKIHKIY